MARLASCVALILLFVLSVQAEEKLLASEVPGATQNNKGEWVIEHEGTRYAVVDDAISGKPYFLNPSTQEAAWLDPRTGKVASRTLDVKKAGKKDKVTHPTEKPPVTEKAQTGQTTLLVVAGLPVILLIAGFIGRIGYLQTYYPDLLFPSKERKIRKRKQAGMIAQKARGKMSQDGKGGRSANS